MRPASETPSRFVQASLRRRGMQKAPTKKHLNIRLDADLVAHFRSTGQGRQSRINETLRKAVFG